MTITIPMVVFWFLGSAAVIFFLALAVVGVVFLWTFRNGFNFWR